jgi:PAS domain S-box-containing protein
MNILNAATPDEFWRGNEGAPRVADGGLLQSVKPFIAAAAVMAAGSMLVATIYFTMLDLEWIEFLGGVLFASILAMTAQAARAQIASAARAERLIVARHQLGRETEQREDLEKLLGAANARLHYSDELLPVMVAYVDRNSRYVYHNRAFSNGLGMQNDKIDGEHMRDVLGWKVFAEVEAYVLEAISGRVVRFERTHKTPTGGFYRLAVQYLPHFGGDGKCTGFYKTITDITERRDVQLSPGDLAAGEPDGVTRLSPVKIGNVGSPNSGAATMPDESVAALEAEWRYASERILAAINGNEFTLFCQRITPLARDGSTSENYEMLIRLPEEENGLILPGAFFALAEEHGLLPQLDRWVITNVLDWMLTPVGAATVRAGAIYFINIATATISDPDFPEFVESQLRRTGIPGHSMCVEIAEQDLTLHQGDAVAFARAMKKIGCQIAISGFGQERVPTNTLKLLPLDFLKIDGGIVRQINACPTYLGKALLISKVAKAIGVRTIGEMVEDEDTLAILRKLNVDFAQGFGISVPQPLTDLKETARANALA